MHMLIKYLSPKMVNFWSTTITTKYFQKTAAFILYYGRRFYRIEP